MLYDSTYSLYTITINASTIVAPLLPEAEVVYQVVVLPWRLGLSQKVVAGTWAQDAYQQGEEEDLVVQVGVLKVDHQVGV